MLLKNDQRPFLAGFGPCADLLSFPLMCLGAVGAAASVSLMEEEERVCSSKSVGSWLGTTDVLDNLLWPEVGGDAGIVIAARTGSGVEVTGCSKSNLLLGCRDARDACLR